MKEGGIMKNLKVSIALFLGIGFTVASLVIIGIAGASNINSLNDNYSALAESSAVL
jgi:hypothetical protein